MSGIFISYRREDSAPYAGRLYDRRVSARTGFSWMSTIFRPAQTSRLKSEQKSIHVTR